MDYVVLSKATLHLFTFESVFRLQIIFGTCLKRCSPQIFPASLGQVTRVVTLRSKLALDVEADCQHPLDQNACLSFGGTTFGDGLQGNHKENRSQATLGVQPIYETSPTGHEKASWPLKWSVASLVPPNSKNCSCKAGHWASDRKPRIVPNKRDPLSPCHALTEVLRANSTKQENHLFTLPSWCLEMSV